jgi:hypothetical protein
LSAIPTDCKDPSVELAVVPSSVAAREDFSWLWAVQALYAHLEMQLDVVSEPPPYKPKQLQFFEWNVGRPGPDGKGTSTALIAHCFDAATCNQLAAMYRATVPKSKPRPVCGSAGLQRNGKPEIPGELIMGVAMVETAQWSMRENATAQCARLGICRVEQDHAASPEIALECQRAPTKHRAHCAMRDTCKEVVACLDQSG